ncbi:hypothetical protein Vretimale_14563 [Volvox reticuliferus]|uniref:Uncharacterized protein n=2 Tax=Volvox reticuliferus TaxID=1737510 RepID=A0A8J4LV98_9CHLO|nr:hypothetical protein Vretifemale_13288 [Volvox reticuliferus]GIM10977.1 hypothetical protein Vretimale_14563 [Volvox reticuliferus]
MDRVHHLESLCQMLPGSAVSAAVYLPLVQPHGVFLLPRNEALVQETQAKLQEVFNRLEFSNDTCSLRMLLLSEVVADRALASLVPINALRNAALLAIRTPLAAMIDVDLAISDSLKSILADPNKVQAMQQAATSFWVLPAWESESHLKQQDAQNTVLSAIKGDKQRLAMLWQSRHLRMFSEDVFPQGHNATDYRRWLSAEQPYAVRYARGYEPWGITTRERYMVMPYDIRFRGCFRDKVTQVASLAYINTSFAAIPDAWLVHQPHKLSAAASIAFGHTGKRSNRVEALQQVVFYRGINTTKFMLHKAHSLVTSDDAMGAMAAGRYQPIVGLQFRSCRDSLPWF